MDTSASGQEAPHFQYELSTAALWFIQKQLMRGVFEGDGFRVRHIDRSRPRAAYVAQCPGQPEDCRTVRLGGLAGGFVDQRLSAVLAGRKGALTRIFAGFIFLTATYIAWKALA